MHNFATKLLIVQGCFVVLFGKLTLAVQKVSGSSLIDLPLPASEYESLRHSIYTANIYRDLRGVYVKIRVRGFQIYRDFMSPTGEIRVNTDGHTEDISP